LETKEQREWMDNEKVWRYRVMEISEKGGGIVWISKQGRKRVLATGSYGPKPKKKVHFSLVWDQWASGAG
jgi:hypothetical protein